MAGVWAKEGLLVRGDITGRVGQTSTIAARLKSAIDRFVWMTPAESTGLAWWRARRGAVTDNKLDRRIAASREYGRVFRSKSEPRNLASGVIGWTNNMSSPNVLESVPEESPSARSGKDRSLNGLCQQGGLPSTSCFFCFSCWLPCCCWLEIR